MDIQDLLVIAALIAVGVSKASAADISWSGFGTLGYAQSNKPYNYQRYIDKQGTLRRDSLVGLQMDASLSHEVGVTSQILAAPASDHDQRYKVTVSWAFLSFRPSNDWLFRAGRQRIPLYLSSQNYDVGVTYDFARLPTEMYSISPGNEFDGLSFSKIWNVGLDEVQLEGYWGIAKVDGRTWIRDGIPTLLMSGAVFRNVTLNGKGLVITYKNSDNTYRVGVHGAAGRQTDGMPFPATYPFVGLFPGVGYYQVDPSIPGPGIPTVSSISNTIATVGADVRIGGGFRVIGEFARTFVNSSQVEIANASDRGYVSLLKSVDKWTPYLTYAFLRSDRAQRALYSKVNGNSIPAPVPGSGIINLSQRAGADSMFVYDQYSWAVGASYSLNPTSKIKAEFMRVRIGQVSSLVDAPPGANIRNQSINVISLSYSMVF